MPFWRRRPRRAVAAAFVVLALVTAAITGLGSSLTPSYGDLTPYRASGVVDVRSAPHPVGWSTDLARAALPGVPVRCVSLSASTSSGSYVVLVGAQQPLGSSSNCSTLTSNQVQSTIALFDAATGDVLWTKDLRQVFPDNTGSVVVQNSSISLTAKTVVVQTLVGAVNGVVGLSLATGAVSGSVEHEADVTGRAPDVSGTSVLYSAGTSQPNSILWTLAKANHLDRPLWTAVLPDQDSPRMTKDAVFVELDGHSARIDSATGRITRFGDGSVDIADAFQDDDGLYTSQTVQSGTVVTAWDADGKRLWSRGGVGDLSGVSRNCLVVALPGTTKVTCLDRATGRGRWTTDMASLAFATALTGQTTDDVAVYRSRGNGIEMVLVDGDTGRHEFVLPLQMLSSILSVSRTTGYVRTSSDSGTSTGLTAFDLRTGRTLWTRTTQKNGDTELWGGHLVSIDSGHIARELGDRSPMVLGG